MMYKMFHEDEDLHLKYDKRDLKKFTKNKNSLFHLFYHQASTTNVKKKNSIHHSLFSLQ